MPTALHDATSEVDSQVKLSCYLCSPGRRYDQPFLVTNVTDDWPAMRNFAKQEFLRLYPGPCSLKVANIKRFRFVAHKAPTRRCRRRDGLK